MLAAVCITNNMGVDYYGYSNVRIEPIPAEFRPRIARWSAEKQAEFEHKYEATDHDVRPLILAMNGISRDHTGKFVYPIEVKHDAEDAADAFYAKYCDEPNFIGVCWQKNRMYWKTEDTKKGCADRSYSGFGDFRALLHKLYNLPAHLAPYIPPSTDCAPEHGYIDTEQCMSCLRGLDKVRDTFVPKEWTPDPEKYGINTDHRFTHTSDDIHQDSWFFREFYCVMTLGAEGGVVLVS